MQALQASGKLPCIARLRPGHALLRACRPVSVATQAEPTSDRILRSLSANQEVAVLVVDGTKLVQDAATRHKTMPTATAALGRTLMGGLLMCCFKKEDESLQITFNAEGILKGIQVIAESNGTVKGKVGNPLAHPPLRPDGKLDVGTAVGPGSLAVVRSQALMPKPYTGTVSITSGEIAEDLAVYLAESEQTNSAIALGVQILSDNTVAGAGGYLVQVLPFATDDTLDALEKNLAMLPAVSDLICMGMSLEKITSLILEDIGSDDSHSLETFPTYGPCEKEALTTRMKRAVAALGEDEVKSIIEEEGHVEVTCHFCNESYTFGESEVIESAASASSQP